MTKEIGDVLDAIDPYFPRATAEAMIGRFCAGHMVTVSRKMGVRADLEQLESIDEVWSMCFRKPRPGGRLLGRFLERDIFIGTGLHLREDLGGDEYAAKAADAINMWEERVAPLVPVRSENLGDYLGHVYRDLDEND